MADGRLPATRIVVSAIRSPYGGSAPEVPFPKMAAAFEAGRGNVALVIEPFVTDVGRVGGWVILNPMERTEPEYTIATYFASDELVRNGS